MEDDTTPNTTPDTSNTPENPEEINTTDDAIDIVAEQSIPSGPTALVNEVEILEETTHARTVQGRTVENVMEVRYLR